MPLHSLRFVTSMAVALAIGAAAPTAHSQVHKCTDGAGKTTYSDTPCTRGSKPLNIPNAASETAPDSTVCAQLEDEMNRLAASEKRGTGPSKRRITLHKQYESRCIGISRVPPEKR
jgi:hypothetical protein